MTHPKDREPTITLWGAFLSGIKTMFWYSLILALVLLLGILSTALAIHLSDVNRTSLTPETQITA